MTQNFTMFGATYNKNDDYCAQIYGKAVVVTNALCDIQDSREVKI
jgi:hypothetical protein